MGQRIKMRRDTTANWTASNPILLDGEIGYDKTLKQKKIGDGVTAWTGLGFVQTAWVDVTGKPAIPAAQVSSDWNSIASPTQILNKPVIPAAQVQSDWAAASGITAILNKPAGNLLTDASAIDGGAAAG